jgi:hypothetical protein
MTSHTNKSLLKLRRTNSNPIQGWILGLDQHTSPIVYNLSLKVLQEKRRFHGNLHTLKAPWPKFSYS